MCEKAQLPFSKIIGVTKFNEFKVSYEWRIHNLKISMLKPGQAIESALFGPEENHDIKWNIELYLKGYEGSYNKDYISIFLVFHPSGNVTDIEANFELGILDKLGQMKNTINDTHWFKVDDDNCGSANFITRSDLLKNDNLLPNGSLTLIINIVGSTNFITLPNLSDNFISSQACHCNRQQSVYEALFNSQKLSDVTFHVSEKKLCAHKIILAAQSPVFLAMFENDMKEKSCGQVDINDVSFEVFQEMLKFIYCGKSDNMSTFANDLLILADKYDIQALKGECEKYLGHNINADNVIDILTIADICHALRLKNYAIDFLIKHKNELVQKDVFESIRKLQPETMYDIIRGLILQ